MLKRVSDFNGPEHVVVIGAGVGGLAAGLRLSAAGVRVTLLERHNWVGGKMRTVPSDAGPVDAGPTVLTMRDVFDDLFEGLGTRLEDHVTLDREPCLARHFWPDGDQLDLFDDPAANADAIAAFAGPGAKADFLKFADEARQLFELFEAPMMRARAPSVAALTRRALAAPARLGMGALTSNLARHLRSRFKDPRLAQLFGRYATYVGGAPEKSPALLALIWQAEAAGVWRVRGGMHGLARAMAGQIEARGGRIVLGAQVDEIQTEAARVTGVRLGDGTEIACNAVVFNGDPRAVARGALGRSVAPLVPSETTEPRSHSARVWSFAARPEGPELAHHNVFFARDPGEEFRAIAAGQMPQDPTIYICAEDRGTGLTVPQGLERFEIILNAAPLGISAVGEKEKERCLKTTFQTLRRFGLRFTPEPDPKLVPNALTGPTEFETLFPGSAGALYGPSPHGLMSALRRPRSKTKMEGLYLAGGGVHPGPGVPMAALSGRHAAEAILADHALT